MKRIYIVTVITSILVILSAFAVKSLARRGEDARRIKVGVLYIGDASENYTNNFVRAVEGAKQNFGDSVEIVPRYNVPEGGESESLQEFVDEGCELIISTSYGFGDTTKEFAEKYPDIQFCQATCSNANTEPVLSNYHTFMGEIYQGRYISGVVAGMKLKELIDEGEIDADEAKVGYVGAYPYAEVISGYTAFFLGVRSVVPEAVMSVIYTNTWSGYSLEKRAAEELIADGCVIISQHSDTLGPAAACEDADKTLHVYHVGYNRSMANVAPTTNLTGCRINWQPYITSAMEAVLSDKKIESCVDGHIHGQQDSSAGFDESWVEMLKLNESVAPEGAQERIDELTEQFKRGKTDDVFKGDYIGVNPFDETDTYDLSKGYKENENCSAPMFNYVLRDVITIKQWE